MPRVFARLALAALALAGCGDNILPDGVPIESTRDLVIVAHQDDDLLFMQPDELEAVQSGAGVTIVYVTAGNGTDGTERARDRDRGVLAAYDVATANAGWTCGWIEIAEHAAEHCRATTAHLSLVFLAYPDGGKSGEYASSLRRLWEGSIDSAETVALRPTRYDRAGLVATLAEIVTDVQPRVIRTLEVAGTHGRDHGDHVVVGALAVVAAATAGSQAELISYRGYNIGNEAEDQLPEIYARSSRILGYYEACDRGCAACGEPCSPTPAHVTWLHRRYAVAMRRAGRGVLRLADQCLRADPSGTLVLGDCGDPQVWTLTPARELATGGLCVRFDGDLTLGGCDGATPVWLDDEGHLWLGIVPDAPEADRRLLCVVARGDEAHAVPCGIGEAPSWELAMPAVSTPRAQLGMVRAGRGVRLGDLTHDGRADLCELRGADLMCAPGVGDGTFAPPVWIASLAVDPDSLTLVDVDGDGDTDACGRDATGLVCAIAASGFSPVRWSSAFGDGEATSETSASLAAVGSQICGLVSYGVTCTSTADVRSSWPTPDAALWPADLDGDGRPDWCAATPDGPACAVDAEREVTAAGDRWAFAAASSALGVATTALADIDGDGRADLCTLDAQRVSCTRSQGRGFGPAMTLAVLPIRPSSLWLGDLDGDGRADACASDDTTIACALSP